MTRRGAEALREELRILKTEMRPRIIAAISEARAHGDLKENAEYHAAREQQSFAEGRIAEIESKLAHAQIIDVRPPPEDGRVLFGAIVHVTDGESGEEMRYQIVGEDEADSRKGMISIHSPIARALISKCEGDIVHVKTPGGLRELEIVQVVYL